MKSRTSKRRNILALLVALLVLASITSCSGAPRNDAGPTGADQQQEATSPVTLAFSDAHVEVVEAGSALDPKPQITVTGTVSNDSARPITVEDLPTLENSNGTTKAAPKLSPDTVAAGDSGSFTYQCSAGAAELDVDWSFAGLEDIALVGTDKVTDALDQELLAYFERALEALDEAEAQMQAEAEATEDTTPQDTADTTTTTQQQKTEASREDLERKHLETICFVAPGGETYHENPTCPELNGERNLTELAIEEAIDGGYAPCNYCTW